MRRLHFARSEPQRLGAGHRLRGRTCLAAGTAPPSGGSREIIYHLRRAARTISKKINDTGIDFCRDHTTGADTTVTPTTTCTAAQGGQDARFGRDPAAQRGALTKVGGGSKGFDLTKIANDGSTLPASASLGSNPTDWAWTYDNNTGLM